MHKKILTAIIACLLIIYALHTIDVKKSKALSIEIDLSRPVSIQYPCEIAIVNTSGQKGLRIPPKVGRGWANEAGGKAEYKFYIPKNDNYTIWAYALWYDECTNAVFARMDEQQKAIIGNDPLYKKWHWVRGFKIHLEKGTHNLTLENHSDHISIQKILLTNSPSAKPQNAKTVFSDIFYDGFDGCDKGNFSKWKIISGEWLVKKLTRKIQPGQNVLIGKAEKNAFIIYKKNNWENYSLNLSLKPLNAENSNTEISICFALQTEKHYHFLNIKKNEKTNLAELHLARRTNETINTLANYEIPWKSSTWHQLEIRLNKNSIIINIDNAETKSIPLTYSPAGGIGLKLDRNSSACFDNIHITKIQQLSKRQNEYD